MIEFLENYINNISRTPKQYHQGLLQATLNSRWEDTTQVYTVKEQVALPFTDEYVDYEAWVSTVSDTLINYSKVYSDFIRLLFKDINHNQNYKGQYYKLSTDGEHEELYICYDRINKITQIPECKCVRCNNTLTWINKSGKIVSYPCYLGTDITSTNNLIGKDGITPNARMIILVQNNDDIKSIVKNQRFLFEHSTSFKVEEVNNFMQESDTDGEVTCVKMYVNYNAILPTDNLELNLCDYYDINYSISINQNDIKQVNGFEGTLTADIINKDEVYDLPIVWSSSDDEVVSIDNNGHYIIKGNTGDTAEIICTLKDNNLVQDKIIVTVIEQLSNTKEIIVTPTINSIDENDSIEINVNVYTDNELFEQPISCTTNNFDQAYYSLNKIDNHKYILTNKHRCNTPLILTFSSADCDNIVIPIILNGLL